MRCASMKRPARARAEAVSEPIAEPIPVHTLSPERLTKAKRLKPVNANPVIEQCSNVYVALMEADHLPLDVREMLGNMLQDSLGVPHEQRHACQTQVVKMVGDVLAGVEARLQQRLDEATLSVDEADSKLKVLRTTLERAETESCAKRDTVVAWSEAIEKDVAELENMQAALREAENAKSERESHIRQVEREKTFIEVFMVESYMPVKNSSVAKHLQPPLREKVLSLAKDLQLDESLLKVLPVVLSRVPESRSTFENTALTQLEAGVLKRKQELAQMMESLISENVKQTTVITAMSAEMDAPYAKHKENVSVWRNAQAEQERCEAAVEEAMLATYNAECERNLRAENRDAVREELVTFQEGPWSAFQKLEERAVVLPVQEELVDSSFHAADEIANNAESSNALAVES